MKPEFINSLFVEQITDTEWRLVNDFVYASAVLDRLTIVPAGFVTDFASVPRLPFVYWLTAGVAVRAAVIHDYLYRSGSASRKDADKVFAEAMEVTGQAAWRRGLMYAGLRLFGWTAYKSNPVRSEEGTATAAGIVAPEPAVAAIVSAETPDAPHPDPATVPPEKEPIK